MGVSFVRLRLVILGGEARCERFVVSRDSAVCERFVLLKMLINSVLPAGRALISPSTLLMAGDAAIAEASLMETKIKEYHMQVNGML